MSHRFCYRTFFTIFFIIVNGHFNNQRTATAADGAVAEYLCVLTDSV